MDVIAAMETSAMKACAELEECVKLYNESWRSLYDELTCKPQKHKPSNIKFQLQDKIVKAGISSQDRMQGMVKNTRLLKKLKIDDTTAVDVLTHSNIDKAASEAEAKSKEEKLLSKILNMDLQHCPRLGVLSLAYKDGEKLIPYHIITGGKDPCDVADELWNFAAKCSIKK
ncbi:hypothetical protein MRX96_005159 [Rhipicephalus microplus]|nr:uncharacterized protein LOC119176020 [Rhipicephalus microplus]